MSTSKRKNSVSQRAHYSPPWANTSIIGIAGSSGSGKTSLALAIVRSLNLPWVVILSMDSYYKPLTPEQLDSSFRNEFDFDSPEAIDFDALVRNLEELKAGKKADIPIWSFEKHARADHTNSIYSPHVLILEGIFALHDARVLAMLDLRIFADAEPDLCLSRRLLRDVQHRGRDIDGCIKQWFAFVKPNFHRYVEPQRAVADLIVPRGVENTVAIGMVSDRIHKMLAAKSRLHQLQLRRLGTLAENAQLSANCIVLPQSSQVVGVNTLLLDPLTERGDFVFYFDRIARLLVERAVELQEFALRQITTALGVEYMGMQPAGDISAVVILRGGCAMEAALQRVIPACLTGRLLIQTNVRTGEPELHFLKLPNTIERHALVLLLDAQMSSGGAALMAVRVLVDHGVPEDRIVFCTYMAGRKGIARLLTVFPEVRIVVGRIVDDLEERWVEVKYLGC